MYDKTQLLTSYACAPSNHTQVTAADDRASYGFPPLNAEREKLDRQMLLTCIAIRSEVVSTVREYLTSHM